MTAALDRPVAPQPAPPAGRSEIPAVRVAGAALTLLAVVLLGFVVHLTVVSHLRYGRAQQTAFADFRASLAEGTAPVGQTDIHGRLLEIGTPVAVLRIPALGTEQVVVEGTTSAALREGPGHRRDTPLPGQAGTSVLMGRSAAYGGPFRDLSRLRAGDALTVVTGQGVHEFRVRGLRRPGEPVPPAPAPGAGRLTLITADGSPYLPTDVIRLDADLTSPVQPAAARALGPRSLLQAEAAMAGDGGAWVPLALWGQALFVAVFAVSWAWARWGGRQAWVVGAPVLAALGLALADQVARLLPNLY